MKFLAGVILTAAMAATAAAQGTGISLPVRLDGAYEVAGFDGVKPHSRGTLTLSTSAIQFASARASATVPITAIPHYSVSENSREVVPGTAGWLLQTASIVGLINPLLEAGAIGSGLGVGMLRTNASALQIDYMDSGHGLHKAVFLLPRNGGDAADRALVSLNVPAEAVAPLSHPTFSKNANLLSSRITLGKGGGTIRVADLAGNEGGMPPFLKALIYEQLVSQLNASGYFKHVLRAGEDIPPGAAGELFTLETSVTAFGEGKPRLRLATIGFGKARITAEVRISDSSSNVLKDNVVNAKAGDDQSSLDACRLLARRVTGLITKNK
jgi:hypothetical protein